MLVHPTIITYVDDSALENLTIYIFYPHFINSEGFECVTWTS